MNNNYYKSPKSSWLKQLFWRSAGADRYLLERSTYSDQIKYFCLGGIVIATGCMAAMAGGYAFYMIFEPKGDALNGLLTDDMVAEGISSTDLTHWPTVIKASIFGIIWGLIIYNIDRFIVTSTGKGDGTEAITKQEIKSAIPRLVMGAIIALTISKPVEIRMFEAEIDAEIAKLQNKESREENEKIDQEYLVDFSRIDSLIQVQDTKIAAADQKVIDQDELVHTLQAQYIDETQGGSGNGRGDGDIAKGILAQKDAEEKKLILIQEKAEKDKARHHKIKSGFESERKLLTAVVNDEKQEIRTKINAMDGLLLKLKLAHQEAGWLISLFITLLFMVIELTPIFFKMMLIKGPYDYMDENVKELARAELGIEIEYDFYTDKEGIDKHKVTNHAAQVIKNQRIATLKAQDELNKSIIEKWKERELKNIQENPDDYLTND